MWGVWDGGMKVFQKGGADIVNCQKQNFPPVLKIRGPGGH